MCITEEIEQKKNNNVKKEAIKNKRKNITVA